MQTMDINIATFINPHLFFITEFDSKHRSSFLHDISARIKKSHGGPNGQNDSFIVDEMVAVFYESNLVRATILEKISNHENNRNIFCCWLIDYAVLIQTEKVFKLPQEIQKITPRAKQACLYNICYLKEQLELGVTGNRKLVPSIIPSSGTTQYCLELLSDCSKLAFEVVERYDNILIGEIIIYKNNNVLYLTQELCRKGLVAVDNVIFERIKFSTKEYIKTHLDTIHRISKDQKIPPPRQDIVPPVSPIKIGKNDFSSELEEMDVDASPVLENGRRRRTILNKSHSSSYTSGSEDDKAQDKRKNIIVLNKSLEACKAVAEENLNSLTNNLSADENNQDQLNIAAQKVSSPESVKSNSTTRSLGPRALQMIKQKRALEEAKKSLEQKESNIAQTKSRKSSDDSWKKLVEFRKQRTLSCSTKSGGEDFDSTCESSLEENTNVETMLDKSMPSEKAAQSKQVPSNTSKSELKKSPFGDITSQRSIKPKGLFLPAGMERRFNQEQQKSALKKGPKKITSEKRKSQFSKDVSCTTPDDDCPTIKIPVPSGNLTDEKISAGETEETTEQEKEEASSSSSDPLIRREVFTKQDYCKLMNKCTCSKCIIAMEDDDWDAPIKFESSESEPKKKRESPGLVIKPPKLLRKELEGETFVQQNEILSIDYGSMSVIEKKVACKILVHGESIPNPIIRVAHVNIHRDIYNNISRLNYKEAKKIQHYAFPAITRNQHVFMINDAGTGKTMAYLPILSSFIREKEDRYSQLLKMGGGPIIVILCSNSRKCEEVYDLAKLIFDRLRLRMSLVTYPGHGNISNIEILITMPTILTNLIASRAINFKRLCHFVLEDGDVILKSHNEMVKKFLDYCDQVLEHRHCPKSIQIILCAEHWTPHIEDLLKKLNKVPLVCIGNYLEAALYGKFSFTMKFLDTSCKDQQLQKILQDVYKFTRSIIICNPDEVEDIETFLPLKGIEYTTIPDVGMEDTSYLEVVWSNALPDKYSVLICTDDTYNTMNITNAQLLIHYSLPRSWTQFIKRFSCLIENNPTPLNIKERKDKVSSYVFIDENCEPRMNKFCNFIKIAGLEKELPEKIKSFFKAIYWEEEHKRVTKKIELCETVKIFGKCDSLHCKKRHVLDKELDRSDILPQNGTIKFKIAKFTDTTTCSVKLLEHFDLKGQSVKQFNDLTDYISEILAKKDSYQHMTTAVENHLYLHKDGDTYYRCKLLEMNDHALVYLIDRGIYARTDLNKLFRMPEEIKKIPQQCFEVYLANLIPPHEDTKFSRSSQHKAQFLVDSNCPNSIMTAKIVLQLGNNLWLNDVCEEREMHDKSLPSIGYQLSRELVKQELAVKSEKAMAGLYTLCKNADIVLPEYKVEKPKSKKIEVEQVKPQWAFLEMDGINQVQFSCGVSPGEFYIKLEKFEKELAELEQDILKEICKPFYPVPQKIEVGKCYLVKDEPTGTYSRAIVLKIAEDQVYLFCVDYGNEATAPVSSLKHISNSLISKLPFQSIQCSMYGITYIDKEWSREATDFLYEYAFEEGMDIFRTLFVKTCSKQRNNLIPSQNSYSVIVKDGFGERHVLLNELLIDCGYAIPDGDEIQDFELPEQKEESEEEDIEEIIRREPDIKVEVDSDQPNDDYFDQFDVEIFDVSGFMTDMQFPVRKIDDEKAIENHKNELDDLPPIKAAPAVDYLTPFVYWSQTESNIKLAIQISDVQEPEISLIRNRIFQFKTQSNGKKYQLKIILYEKVEKTFQYTALGPEVRVVLTKCQKGEWDRLPHTKEKLKNLIFDIRSIKDDEKSRKPLELGISDSSSDEAENDGMAYHVCSDMDSEYDYDIPNDD